MKIWTSFVILLISSLAFSQVTLSPNMSLPVPIPGVTSGPDWANDLNSSLNIIDSHNHTPGSGVQIPTAGININGDLAFNGFSCTLLKTTAYQSQSVPLSGNLGSVYVVGKELYYNDTIGNQVKLTNNGTVNSGPGSISGLPSGTASASFAAGTFTWQSATNTSAVMDAGSYVMRNNVASSHGLTLNPPNAMAADYSLVFPSLPSQTRVLTLDTSGNITASASTGTGTTQSDVLPNFGLTPTGSIIAFGGTAAPAGWALCDGTSYTRTGATAALFGVIGTAYGAADGSHFNVPDLRGKFPRGDNGATSVDPGNRTTCATGGNSSGVGSCEAQDFLSHTHVVTDPGHSHAIPLYEPAATSNVNFSSFVSAASLTPTLVTTGTTSSSTTGITNQNTGGLETRPVNVSVNYLIKL